MELSSNEVVDLTRRVLKQMRQNCYPEYMRRRLPRLLELIDLREELDRKQLTGMMVKKVG